MLKSTVDVLLDGVYPLSECVDIVYNLLQLGIKMIPYIVCHTGREVAQGVV